MTSYGYIIFIVVDSCMIWFHFDCIMPLKKSYHIATNVCSRKSATTFGDLPDCLVAEGLLVRYETWLQLVGITHLWLTNLFMF